MWTTFIGSSKEAKDRGRLSSIQAAVGGELYPILWDSPKAFPSGTYTLARLIDLTDDVDSAILIWDSDDSTWYRGTTRATTRDNCILDTACLSASSGPKGWDC